MILGIIFAPLSLYQGGENNAQPAGFKRCPRRNFFSHRDKFWSVSSNEDVCQGGGASGNYGFRSVFG